MPDAAILPLPTPGRAAEPERREARETVRRDTLRLITCGSVDDGKSTLIGRLLYDTGAVPEDQAAALAADSARWGTAGPGALDFALLLDGLDAEREQGITIDVAYRFFATQRRAFIVADTPGHAQYTANMATGASTAELAVLLVDARAGLTEQTRRHAAIVALLGIRDVVLAINKIDLVGFDAGRFAEIRDAFAAFAAPLGFAEVVAIPLSARDGDNVASLSARTPWHDGPTLLGHLETVAPRVGDRAAAEAPFRMWAQWIARPNADFRGVAGTIAAGRIAVGDPVVDAVSGVTTRVARIVVQGGDLAAAEAGDAVTLVLADQVDIGRGALLAAPKARPMVGRRFAADLLWMRDAPLAAGSRLLMKLGTRTAPVEIARIEDRLELGDLVRAPAEALARNDIGRVELRAAALIAADRYVVARDAGGFILIDPETDDTVAAGLIVAPRDAAGDVHRHATRIDPGARARAKHQAPLCVWLTGLPGSGKSTIADHAERRLHAAGRHVMLLDGDALRQGLNQDLGFDRAARAENVRRAAEAAKLMCEAGLIVLVALVSPYRADREAARALFPDGGFVEVHVDADPATCAARDPKGLYAKAAAGALAGLTGAGDPYEPPAAPDLVLDTTSLTPEAAGALLADLVERRIGAAPATSLDASQL